MMFDVYFCRLCCIVIGMVLLWGHVNLAKKISPDRWFKEYSVVNVWASLNKGNRFSDTNGNANFTNNYVTERLNFSARLHADQKQVTQFTIELIKEIPFTDYASITINNKTTAGENKVIKEIDVFKGEVISPCCKNRAIVKITKDGIDAMIQTENEAYYIEPACRYSLKDTEMKKLISAPPTKNKNGQNVVRTVSVFYKASDVYRNVSAKALGVTAPMHSRNISDLYSRQSRRYKRSFSSTECTLNVVADHTFFMRSGHSTVLGTVNEIAYYVLEANLIFRSTDFNGDGQGDNIGFVVTNVTIFTRPTAYTMVDAKTSSSEYLTLFSNYNFENYCLSVVFSSVDFDDGVVGLAWVASSSMYGGPGGICQRRLGKFSYNTLLVTTTNAAERLPMYQSALTLTHEFGHSFGSPHDNVGHKDCSPNDAHGNFIMHPFVLSGTKSNHNQFSSCSVNYIFPVLRNKAWRCFQEIKRPFCGNFIREKGEECDCGDENACDKVDPCCTPSNTNTGDKPCTFRRSLGYTCSRRHDGCCDDRCRIINSAAQTRCRSRTDCTQDSICDGISKDCPAVITKPDRSVCNDGKMTCKDGTCSESICAVKDLFTCSCAGENACYMCCLDRNSSQCVLFKNDRNQLVYRHAGDICNDQGYCNGQGYCMQADAQSALDRFTRVNIDTVINWLATYWYYIVASIVTFLACVTLFISTCRGNVSIHSQAYMFGQFCRVQTEVSLEKHYLQNRREKVRDLIAREMECLDEADGCAELDVVTALARLMTFFPTVSRQVLEKVLVSDTNEEAAVMSLVGQNYPVRRLSSTADSPKCSDDNMSLDQE